MFPFTNISSFFSREINLFLSNSVVCSQHFTALSYISSQDNGRNRNSFPCPLISQWLLSQMLRLQYQLWCVNICSYIAHDPKMIFMFLCFAYQDEKWSFAFLFWSLWWWSQKLYNCQAMSSNLHYLHSTHLPSQTFLCLNISISLALEFVYILHILQFWDRRRADHLHTHDVYSSLVCMCMSMCI